MTAPHLPLDTFQTVSGFQRWTTTRQFVLPAMLAGAALSIFVYGVLQSPIHDPAYAAQRSSHIAAILAAATIMLLHSAYLLMMAQHLVYSQPVDRNLGASPWVLAFIAAAYLSIGLNAGLTFVRAPTIPAFVTYGLFALSYLTLAVRGVAGVHGKHFQLPRTQISTRYFLFVDAGFGILFLKSTISAFSSQTYSSTTAGESLAIVVRNMTGMHPVYLAAVTNKEILILLVLLFYTVARTLVDRRLTAHASSTYEAYQSHNLIPATQDDSLHAVGDSIGYEKSWLDYGSGSGVRLVELLELIYPAGVQPARTVVLYDADMSVYETLDSASLKRLEEKGIRVEKGQVYVDPIKRRERLGNIDVLLLSHITYDPPRILRILEDIACLKEDSRVVIRVTGSTGLFRAISVMFSTRLVYPSSRHSVPQILLEELQKDYGFRQVRQARITQRYALNHKDAPVDLARWCDIRYGENVGLHTKKYAELLQRRGIVDLPNDDDIYVLERVSGGRHPPPAKPVPRTTDAAAASAQQDAHVTPDIVAETRTAAAVRDKYTGDHRV
jgi:hypothetical protein